MAPSVPLIDAPNRRDLIWLSAADCRIEAVQLREKQKAKYSYGLFERQFKRFFADAEKQAGITGENLVVLLERRLDNVVYKLGFADSRSQARQLILTRTYSGE